MLKTWNLLLVFVLIFFLLLSADNSHGKIRRQKGGKIQIGIMSFRRKTRKISKIRKSIFAKMIGSQSRSQIFSILVDVHNKIIALDVHISLKWKSNSFWTNRTILSFQFRTDLHRQYIALHRGQNWGHLFGSNLTGSSEGLAEKLVLQKTKRQKVLKIVIFFNLYLTRLAKMSLGRSVVNPESIYHWRI